MTGRKDLTVSDFLKNSFIQINRRPHKGKQKKNSSQTSINKVFFRGRHTVPFYESIRKRKRQEKKL
jgi:hypothetical protein